MGDGTAIAIIFTFPPSASKETGDVRVESTGDALEIGVDLEFEFGVGDLEKAGEVLDIGEARFFEPPGEGEGD